MKNKRLLSIVLHVSCVSLPLLTGCLEHEQTTNPPGEHSEIRQFIEGRYKAFVVHGPLSSSLQHPADTYSKQLTALIVQTQKQTTNRWSYT